MERKTIDVTNNLSQQNQLKIQGYEVTGKHNVTVLYGYDKNIIGLKIHDRVIKFNEEQLQFLPGKVEIIETNNQRYKVIYIRSEHEISDLIERNRGENLVLVKVGDIPNHDGTYHYGIEYIIETKVPGRKWYYFHDKLWKSLYKAVRPAKTSIIPPGKYEFEARTIHFRHGTIFTSQELNPRTYKFVEKMNEMEKNVKNKATQQISVLVTTIVVRTITKLLCAMLIFMPVDPFGAMEKPKEALQGMCQSIDSAVESIQKLVEKQLENVDTVFHEIKINLNERRSDLNIILKNISHRYKKITGFNLSQEHIDFLKNEILRQKDIILYFRHRDHLFDTNINVNDKLIHKLLVEELAYHETIKEFEEKMSKIKSKTNNNEPIKLSKSDLKLKEIYDELETDLREIVILNVKNRQELLSDILEKSGYYDVEKIKLLREKEQKILSDENLKKLGITKELLTRKILADLFDRQFLLKKEEQELFDNIQKKTEINNVDISQLKDYLAGLDKESPIKKYFESNVLYKYYTYLNSF
ncbi:hypothetical protein [Saccharolobus islandicus]|uniref:Uncharacterized protein n=1 Tax=Saccharolobus islandicus (strain M.16.4 / Kamchatka \|nr:hypothetical protein [Sulfolobus islandicus]ACR41516.1 hypothetical protein M164_0904 [Sulfolobus islandicus M.16.4]